MKKVLSLIAIAAISATVIACGPSKEALEAAEKAKTDSIAKADSTASAEAAAKLAEQAKADSLAMVAKADSARVADSIAAAGKKGGKKKK